MKDPFFSLVSTFKSFAFTPALPISPSNLRNIKRLEPHPKSLLQHDTLLMIWTHHPVCDSTR